VVLTVVWCCTASPIRLVLVFGFFWYVWVRSCLFVCLWRTRTWVDRYGCFCSVAVCPLLVFVRGGWLLCSCSYLVGVYAFYLWSWGCLVFCLRITEPPSPPYEGGCPCAWALFGFLDPSSVPRFFCPISWLSPLWLPVGSPVGKSRGNSERGFNTAPVFFISCVVPNWWFWLRRLFLFPASGQERLPVAQPRG